MLFRELRVAITGASSFTAFWIARAFSAQGARVTALCKRKSLESYEGLKRKRLELLSSQINLNFGIQPEDGSMAFWVDTNRPDIWIHHNQNMESYRSPSYDMLKADRVGVDPLHEIFRSLRKSGTKGIIFSGSYMEPGEGGTKNPANASPFAMSRFRNWEAVQVAAREMDLLLCKVVIPSPVGPLENDDRLIPSLIRHAKERRTYHITNGDSVMDYIPGKVLASVYLDAASDILRKESRVRRPSGLVSSVKNLVDSANNELLVRRLNLSPCATVLVSPQEPKIVFTNIATERQRFEMQTFWDEYSMYANTGEVIRDFKLTE